MKSSILNRIEKGFLIYFILLILTSIYTHITHIIFRRSLKILNFIIILAGVLFLLFSVSNRISSKQKPLKIFIRILMIVILTVSSFFGFLHFAGEQEYVEFINKKKMIKTESSSFLFYQISYHDYENPFWYFEFPCVVESYDDGDPDQYVYTDHYDENGVLIERIFAEN